MTTLFNSDRDPNKVNRMQMDEFIQAIVKISVDNSITVDQTLKAAEILELRRRNNLLTVDGEMKDQATDEYLKQLTKINESLMVLLEAGVNG